MRYCPSEFDDSSAVFWIIHAVHQRLFYGGNVDLVYVNGNRFVAKKFGIGKCDKPIGEKLETVLNETATRSGVGFDVTSVHEAGAPIEYTQINVQYDAILDQKNTTDIDITFNESLEFSPVRHRHTFEDIPIVSLHAYSIEEILVEKLRSLYQRARARDYYDIYHLLEQETFDNVEILHALQAKSTAHNVEIDIDNGIPDDDIEDVRVYWERALNRLVQEMPSFDSVVQRIDTYLLELTEYNY
jgi:predicted nucleotidyltransferase component of viral defense system